MPKVEIEKKEGAWLWVQKWTESEAGWGQRPDGYTLHVEKEDIGKFLQAMRDREAERGYGAHNVPTEYSRPEGSPYRSFITEPEEIERVEKSEHGAWGSHGNNYPPGGEGTGWVSVN